MKIKVDKKAVGQRIKKIRLDKGMTLEEFGKLFGASFGNVKSWEMGMALPNASRINTICKIANITRNELLYGSIDELINNNMDIICKELNCSKIDLIALINDIWETIHENIDINSNTVFNDIVIYLKKSIEKLKSEYKDEINSLLQFENLQVYLKSEFLSQSIGDNKYIHITEVDDLKNLYDLYIEDIPIINIYDNILDLINFEAFIREDKENILKNTIKQLKELLNIMLTQQDIIKKMKEMVQVNELNEDVKIHLKYMLNELIKNDLKTKKFLEDNKNLDKMLEELENKDE